MSTETLPPETHVDDMTLLEAYRENFTRDLVSTGLISTEFAQSGILDEFGLFEESEYGPESDALVHLLAGDILGGGHHIKSIMEVGHPDSHFAAAILHPTKPKSRLKEDQRRKKNGVYMLKDVLIVDRKSGMQYDKEAYSTMFPDDWSTEDVINAVVEARQSGDKTEPDMKRQSYACTKEIAGVKVVAIVDLESDKIKSGFPR